jgi:serine protease Do
VNTLETREKERISSQRPPQVPWLVICSLVAALGFLAGHIIGNIDNNASAPTVTDGLTPLSHKTNLSNGRGMTTLPLASQNPVADIVKSAEPAVVSIDTVIHERPAKHAFPELLFPHSNRRSQPREKYEAHGAGSGIIVRSDGYIMTNFHVIKGADDIKITLNDGRRFPGKVVGHDGYSDVAMVKIDANSLPVARLGSSQTVRPGDWAIAIGSPLGLSHTVTMGIVSAVGRSLADLNNNVDLIQTDAAINPGNSGGPLLNIEGEVVGINMAIRTDAQNIGFSIPIDVAREAATSIIKHRPLIRPYLGLSMVDFDPQLARRVGLPAGERGVLVSKVAEKGPAARSGIEAGDLIETIENAPVRKGSDIQRLVRSLRVGDRLRMQIFRAGKVKNVDVILRSYPRNAEEGSEAA